MTVIKLKNRAFDFNLEFYGKLNFVLGDSGTQRSYFVSLCNKIALGLKSITGEFIIDGRKLERSEIFVFDNEEHSYDYDLLRNRHGCLFIIDVFSQFYQSKDFPSLLLDSDNYFILMTRRIPGFLPEGMRCLYKFKRNGNSITNLQIGGCEAKPVCLPWSNL